MSKRPTPQDRPGQLPQPNTWDRMILNALPEDRYVSTNALFQEVAARHRRLDFAVYKDVLVRLKRRRLIERVPTRSRNHEALNRRLVPVLKVWPAIVAGFAAWALP